MSSTSTVEVRKQHFSRIIVRNSKRVMEAAQKKTRQKYTRYHEKHDVIYELQHCFFGGSVGGAGIIVPLPPPYPCRSVPTCLFDTDL